MNRTFPKQQTPAQLKVKELFKAIILTISAVRLVPHIIFLACHPARECIEQDIKRWSRESILKKKPDTPLGIIWSFIQLMTILPEYRNLFYYRMGWFSRALYPLCRPMSTLIINFVDEGIGPGLYIQHGFSTIISAKRIGRNCWINQQVTIGYTNDTDKPTIGDNVTIAAGAKVLGNVTIGDNSIVGANAAVVKDVPENCTVAGVPAYIVRRNGIKVKETL
jgi:serine O-acetyltransferase